MQVLFCVLGFVLWRTSEATAEARRTQGAERGPQAARPRAAGEGGGLEGPALM